MPLEAAIRKLFALISATFIITALSACTATTTPTPVQSESASSAPSKSPAAPSKSPAAAEPTGILIGAEATDIVDEAGNVLLSLRYSDDGDAAVALATDVLGTPQGEHPQEGTAHQPPMDGTSWDGFDIVVIRYSAELEPQGDERFYKPAFTVQATAATTGSGISIAAVDGTRIGDSFDAVSAGKPEAEVHLDDAFGGHSTALDLPTSFPGIIEDAGPGIKMAYGVIGWSGKDSDSITKIKAPTYLFSLS